MISRITTNARHAYLIRRCSSSRAVDAPKRQPALPRARALAHAAAALARAATAWVTCSGALSGRRLGRVRKTR